VARLPSPPLLWRYGCRGGTMTRVMSGQGVVPVLLLTVHGHVHPIDSSKCHSQGPPWLPVLPAGSTCPLGKAKTCHRGLRRGGEMLPETPIILEASPQGSGEIEFVVCVLSGRHVVSAF
jgi:hypothetical protein